jgi:hypothetical protein
MAETRSLLGASFALLLAGLAALSAADSWASESHDAIGTGDLNKVGVREFSNAPERAGAKSLGLRSVAAKDGSPRLTGDYLGQPLPGATPAVFARGIVSTGHHEHSAPALSPDGRPTPGHAHDVYWVNTAAIPALQPTTNPSQEKAR